MSLIQVSIHQLLDDISMIFVVRLPSLLPFGSLWPMLPSHFGGEFTCLWGGNGWGMVGRSIRHQVSEDVSLNTL